MLRMRAIFLALCAPAHAGFFTYSEWEALPPNLRAIYIAGAFNSLVSTGSDDDYQVAVHYSNCKSRTRMNTSQLAKNVVAFARARPEMQGGTPQEPLVNYLISLCGKAP